MSPSSIGWWRELSWRQWASFGAAWLGWVLDAFDFTVFLLVMKQIAAEFGTTLTTTASSIALTLLMRLVGGVLAGWAADRWGRKLPLMISIVWFAICDGLVSLAPSFERVLLLRAVFGLGMGAEWTAGSTLAMENWPARARGVASGVLQGSWAIGFLLAGLAAGWVVPTYGWRALFFLAAAPAVLAIPIRFLVPESAEWQASRAALRTKTQVSWREIVSTPHVPLRLLWATLMLAAGFGGYYALVGNSSVLLLDHLGHDMAGVARQVTVFNVGMLVGAVVCGLAAMRMGVRVAVLVPAVVMALVVPLYVGFVPEWLWVGAFLGGVFGAGTSGVTPMLLTSLFPARVRARCIGLVYHLAAIPAAFVPMAIAALDERRLARLPVGIALVCAGSQVALAILILVMPRTDPVEVS